MGAFRSPNYKKDMEYNDKYKKNEGIRNYLQNTTQKIKEWAMWTPLKLRFNIGVPEGLEYPRCTSGIRRITFDTK